MLTVIIMSRYVKSKTAIVRLFWIKLSVIIIAIYVFDITTFEYVPLLITIWPQSFAE